MMYERIARRIDPVEAFRLALRDPPRRGPPVTTFNIMVTGAGSLYAARKQAARLYQSGNPECALPGGPTGAIPFIDDGARGWLFFGAVATL